MYVCSHRKATNDMVGIEWKVPMVDENTSASAAGKKIIEFVENVYSSLGFTLVSEPMFLVVVERCAEK